MCRTFNMLYRKYLETLFLCAAWHVVERFAFAEQHFEYITFVYLRQFEFRLDQTTNMVEALYII